MHGRCMLQVTVIQVPEGGWAREVPAAVVWNLVACHSGEHLKLPEAEPGTS